MGWPLQDLITLSIVARPIATLNAQLFSGVRLLVLSNDGQSPAAVAALLRERGFGPSRLSVLEHLGGEAERRIDGIANDWPDPVIADLNLIAIECIAEPGTPRLSRLAGLPDSAFKHDGQLPNATCAPSPSPACPPGGTLWDVGAGPVRSVSNGCVPPQLPGACHRSR